MTWTKEVPTKAGRYWFCKNHRLAIPSTKSVTITDNISYTTQFAYGGEECVPCTVLNRYWKYIPSPSHPLLGRPLTSEDVWVRSHYKI